MRFFSWNLQPLQNRITNEPAPETNSLFKAISIVWPVLVYNVISQAVMILFACFMLWISNDEMGNRPLTEFILAHSECVSGLVKMISMLAGAGAVWHLFIKETPVFRMPAKHKKDGILLFVLGGCAALSANILLALIQFTTSSDAYNEVAEKQFALPLWAGIILYGIVSPLAEEVVFRGIVFNRLRRQYTRGIAIVGSALIFGVYHGNVVQALYGFVLGILIAVLYEKYASFLAPVILHSAANIFVYVVTSVSFLQEKCMNWPVFLGSTVVFVVLLAGCLSKKGD